MDRDDRIRSARAGSASKPLLAAIGVLAAVIGLVRAQAHKLTGEPIGALCGKGNDCQSGECLTIGLFGHCTEACDEGDDCDAPYGCVDAAGGRYCVEQSAGGTFCRDGSQCQSGACIGPPVGVGMPAIEGKCAAPCGSAQHKRCPERQYCAEVGTMLGTGFAARKLSRPACLDQKPSGAVCHADDQCESANCVSMVVAHGDAEVPNFLQTFKTCRERSEPVGTEVEAESFER